MANEEQLEILKQGVDIWNKWRDENPDAKINLRGSVLSEANLSGVNLSGADLVAAQLRKANLIEADLTDADLRGANFGGADLSEALVIDANVEGAYFAKATLNRACLVRANLKRADFFMADLIEADLSAADLPGANFTLADMTEADLSAADLSGATLLHTTIDQAKISECHVYAVNVWDIKGEFSEQNDLVITPVGKSIITVDNIKMAQFIYMILDNDEIREVLNVFTSKTVLILGRFSVAERKEILDALRNKLREYNLLPVVFDFNRPTDKDFTETIKTLAGLSYFVIADVTNPRSSPLELQATVPDYKIPFVPIIQEGEEPFAMMRDLQNYDWVLDTLSYKSIDDLIKALKPAIIDPAAQKHKELRLIKAREPKIRSASDFVEDKGMG